jgi:ethanolamine ammonia-lyase large subunit
LQKKAFHTDIKTLPATNLKRLKMQNTIKKFKQLPTGLQFLFGAGTLLLMYKSYQIMAQEHTGVQGTKKANLNAQAQAKFDFENTPTITPDQVKSFAKSLQDLLVYGIGNNKAELEAILMRLKNNADVKSVFNAYGSKMTYLYGVPTGMKTLSQTLANEPAENKNKVNTDWKNKDITFKI